MKRSDTGRPASVSVGGHRNRKCRSFLGGSLADCDVTTCEELAPLFNYYHCEYAGRVLWLVSYEESPQSWTTWGGCGQASGAETLYRVG